MQTITVGLTAERETIVTNKLSAIEFGSGSVLVFATPAMIALMEAASVAAIDHLLADNETSVGTLVNVRHLTATALGKTVKVRAEVITVEGRQITFSVQAWDDKQLIGEGSHVRVVVDKDRFMQRVNT